MSSDSAAPGFVLVLSYWNLNHAAFGGARRIEALMRLLGDRALLCQPAPPHPSWPSAVFRPDLGRRKIGVNWGMFNFFLPAAAAKVRSLVLERRPRLVVLTSIWAWAPLRALPAPPPAVLDAHDVLADAVAGRFGPRHPFTRCVAAWERRVVGHVARVIACSERDAAGFCAHYGLPPDRIAVVPNGAEMDHTARARRFAIAPDIASALGGAPFVLFFMGKLDYQPNAAALRFLTDEVMPALERAAPGRFRLLVTGGPPPRRPPAGPVLFAGRVPDVAPYLDRADLCLAPIFSGSGTRLKILEYMAAAKAVVATPKAAEGIEAETERHLVLAEPAKFAQTILRLADDPARREALGRAGRELVRRLYSWDAIRERWRAALAPWLDDRATPSRAAAKFQPLENSRAELSNPWKPADAADAEPPD